MTKTYYVTRLPGQVRRLDDFTLPWVDVSTGHKGLFLDVMAFPSDIEKVVVVGSKRGIFQSIDSGANWTPAGGDYITELNDLQEFHEVWIVNETTSYIAGGNGGVVLKSTDGGLNYNITTSYPTGSGTFDGDVTTTSIHFINELVGVVGVSLGSATAVWKTSNGGATWTQLNSSSLVGSSGTGGIHLSADEQTIVVQLSDGIYRSTDAGLSFTRVLDLTIDFPTGSGLHMTWLNDDTLWVSGNGGTLRQSTDAGATWSTIRPYNGIESSIRGAHFYDAVNGFLGQNQEIHTTTDAGLTTILSEAVVSPNAVWTESQIVEADPCYMLTDCVGIADPIYTGVDLSGNIDQVITLADEDGNEIEGCWFVTQNPAPCDNAQEVTVYTCYDDCDSCLPEPEPIRTPKPRAVNPEFNTGLCDPHIVEKAFCEFGEMMYKKMMEQRFKIENCCPKDEDKINIQFEKVKLLLLQSEDPTPDECNPLCLSYGIDIQIADTAVITYVDCEGLDQTIDVNGISVVQEIRFCGLNTTPPIAVVTHPDQSTDTYTLQPLGDCEPIEML